MLFGLVVSPYPTLERQEQTGTVLLRLRQSTPRRCCVHTEVSLQWFTVSDCNDLDEVCAQADCVVAGGFLRAVSSAQRCQQCRLQLLSRASAFGRSGRSLGSRLGDLLAKFVSRVRRQRNCRCRRLVLLADFLGRLLRRVAVAVAVRSSWDVGMVVAELQVD